MKLSAAARVFARNQCGAIALEFAFISVPLMLLLVGSVETSRFIWTRHALQDAVASGARCVGLNRAECVADGIASHPATSMLVQEKAAGWRVFISEETVTVEGNAECNGVTGFSRVTVRHEFYSVLDAFTGRTIETEACFPMMTQ